ncbi:MAG: nodulation protein NfeD [Burkholderiales bacterium]|nr:nodulation protein NfeD [Burkholderiales bacterium]
MVVVMAAMATPVAAATDARAATAAAPAPVVVARIDGAIGPATADFVADVLERATQQRAQLVVLELDTPGGLDLAMRRIIQGILASPVPVAAYVAPRGARAASAGTYILYAAHVAAMAPATNLGAATPIAIGIGGTAAPPASAASGASGGDTLEAKRINDASAYIRGLAQLRGRDAAWAERAVREAVSLPAADALKQGAIDLVADDLDDLLRQLNGRVVTVAGGAHVTLATAGARVTPIESDWRIRLLSVVSDPSLVLLLLMVGFYGLLFEFMNPGFVLPGVAGAIAIVLALWGLQMLPISYAGLAMVLLGIAFFTAEAFVPSYGALGIGGVVAFSLGALMLFGPLGPGLGVPPGLVAGAALCSLAFVLALATMAARARRRPVVSGAQRLVGRVGAIVEFADQRGWALVEGEHWQVRCGTALAPGQAVRVTRVDGLTLEVAAAPATGAPP